MGIVSKVARGLAKKVTKKTPAKKSSKAKTKAQMKHLRRIGFDKWHTGTESGTYTDKQLRQLIKDMRAGDKAEAKALKAKKKKPAAKKKKGTNIDLATFKKAMASRMKPTRTTAKEKATRVKKKSDKRIEGSGAHSARPPGSIGKTKTADRPRGSASKSGMGTALMSAARKRVKSKNYNTAMAKYDEIPARIRGSISAAIKLGKRSIAKKLLEDYRLSVDQFKEVLDKLKK